MSPKNARPTWFSAFTTFALALFLFGLPARAVAQTGTAMPVASRLTEPIDDTQRVTLKGTIHPLATAANDRGAVDDGMALDRVQVMLKRSNAQETALRELIQEMHQPGSANYHKWLTPAQFGEQFGPSDADIATLSKWLGAHGFAVTKVNPGKQTLEISGSAGQFNKTFNTAIHKYQVNGQMHTANAGEPSIPAALAPVFGGFASLNNFPIRSAIKVRGTAQFDPATHKATPNWTQGQTGYFPTNFLAPGDFAVQYDLNPLYNANVKGAGQTIAIINEANVNPALVAQYRTLFGLPTNPVNVIIDGNDPGIDGMNNPDGPNGASIEAYLDVEQAGAVAPAATIDLVIAADTALNSGLDLAFQHAVYSDVAPVLSVSFQSCEYPGDSIYNLLGEQAAAQGQTVMVAAGDAGSAGCDDDNTQQYALHGQRVNGFASSPYIVAVGGTDFYYSDYAASSQTKYNQLSNYWNENPSNNTPTVSLLAPIQEQPWNDSQFGLNEYNLYLSNGETSIVGGGGGASNCALGTVTGSNYTCTGGYPKPSWQTGTGVPNDSVRDTPDVSLFAADGFNWSAYPICAKDGDCQPVSAGGTVQVTGVGGTSASSPAFAGIMALVNEQYGPQGQADYVLYKLAAQYPTAFHDVTVGNNSVPCAIDRATSGYGPSPNCIAVSNELTVDDNTYGTATEGQIGSGTTPGYNATAGYDLATGLGSVDANVLVSNWNKITLAASTVTLTPSSTSFAHGTAITVSGNVTPPTAGGNVSLETTSTEPLNVAQNTFALSSGAYSSGATVNYLPGGTYQIYAQYGGDGTNGPSTSAKTTITVTPEASATALYAMNEAASSPSNAFASGSTVPYGTQIVLEAFPGSVTAANTTTSPTGTVQFLNGTTVIGTAVLNATGEAALNYAPVPSSSPYSITAVYSGDASYAASTSSAFTFTVAKDTPALGLLSSTQTSAAVTAVSGASALTVSVENYANYSLYHSYGPYFAAPAVAPTGVVAVTGLPGGTLTLPALSPATNPSTNFIEGVATLPLPAEAAGTYTVTINYPGDANYAATTATVSVTITASSLIATTTTATASVSTTTSTTAEAVTFTITGSTGGGVPTGNVNFILSGENIGYLTLPTTGTGDSVTETANLTGYLLTGTNQIVVQYDGSSVYAPSQAIANISNGVAPALALASSGNINLVAGSSGTSTISVTPLNGLTGSVTLSCAVTPATGTSVPTCLVVSPATLTGYPVTALLTVSTTSTTAAGNYIVSINGADGSVNASVTVPVLVTAAVSTTPAISLSNSGSVTLPAGGASGTSTITVTPSGGFTGAVALSCGLAGANNPPTCTVTSPVNITGTTAQTATLTITSTSATTPGSYTAMVTASGTGVAANTVTSVGVTVAGTATSPTVALSDSGSITIGTPGGSGTSTVTVTPGGGFTGSVSLACSVSSTVSEAPTCSIPSPVTISGTTAGTATLTVSTTAASAALDMPRMRLLPIGGGIAAAALLFFLVPMKRRRISSLLAALVLIAVIGFSAGCGGGGSAPAGNPGTPTGTYSVTVSGTATGVTITPITVSVTVN